ncbi:MAG: hypothetical protein BGP06_21510 [Rhizobiales bacterium 65-9]|nr:L,D-transpeptidase [Hyphomicrobiales bacterium]OJY36576.1 MAG: hypothetical protein BGP06_21510 [Rhizobiales bacterium 65-9]
MRRALALVSFALALLPSVAASARVSIRVDLASQTMRVETPGGGAYQWPVSSGKKGFRTPTGQYGAQRLARMHYSSKYDDAPMPHSIFFRGGYAIHATSSVAMLGRPASHGCIRLSPANAALLFSLVKQHGARIAISGNAPGDGRAYASRRAKARVMAQDDMSATVRPGNEQRVRYPAPGFIDAPRASPAPDAPVFWYYR